MKRILSALVVVVVLLVHQTNRASAEDEMSILRQSCSAYLTVAHWKAAVVGRMAIGKQYALCEVHDQHTGNMFLFKESNNAFEFIASGKPTFDVSRLIELGVDPAEANQLVSAISD